MRVFELTTHLQGISRGDGRSATAAAAYRACAVIECEREGRTHDYTRKSGLEAAEIVLPRDAPAWAADRSSLWNAAELVERNGKRGKRAGEFKADARPARELLFSFPAELSAAGRLNVARAIARHLTDTHGVASDFSIHQPGQEGDERNFHCHLMMTARRMTAAGLGEKAREWDDLKKGAALSKALREFVAQTLNRELAAERKADQVHVEHRSFKDRGEIKRATIHEGVTRTNMGRKQRRSVRQAWRKDAVGKQAARHGEERAALKVRHDFALQAKMGHLQEQERLGVKAIRDQLDRDNAADRPQGGLRRAFAIATGRAMRDDFARQQRAADRVQVADRTIEEFRAAMKAARNAFVGSQLQESRTLSDRHKAEDRQLEGATAAHVTADRVAEVEARKDRVRDRDRDRGQERDRDGPTFTLN